MKVILINTPWARNRLQNIDDWWGDALDFEFDIEEVTLPFVPYIKHPTENGIAVLDMGIVNQYKRGTTLFVVPFEQNAKDRNGNPLGIPSVRGLFMPPALPLSRWEWFFTRLFWSSPAMTVHADEHEISMVGAKNLGKTFELYANHEFAHWLYWVTKKEDKTHGYFYSGEPEKAREEILAVFRPETPPTEPEMPPPRPDYLTLMAEAIKKHEGWFEGSRSCRHNNPGNLRSSPFESGNKDSFSVFPDYETGWKALIHQLTIAANGTSGVYKPTDTLLVFFSKYAPKSDSNDPYAYAKSVAQYMGVDISWQIKNLIV